MDRPDPASDAEAVLTSEEISKARTAAALLEQARHIHGVTLIVMAGTIGFAVIASREPVDFRLATLAAGALLATLAELYLSIRLGFDAALFAAISRRELSLRALDSALIGIGLMPAEKAARSIDARIEGAIGLLQRQVFCLAIAVLCLVGAMICVLVLKGRP